MTGIERLRKLANKDQYWYMREQLCAIADQIERETIPREPGDGDVGPKTLHAMALAQLDDWEREAIVLVREHGGLEDVRAQLDTWQDVFSWAVELGGVETCHEAARWVREHGGIEGVKEKWTGHVPRSSVKRMVELHEKKRDRLKAHALWLERKCHERRERIKELDKAIAEMRPRLMPEGMEWLVEAWPRFEDGEPVRVGDEYECWCGETHKTNSITIREGSSMINAMNAHSFVVSDGPTTAHGERVKRPAPKVLDADGAEIRVGDEVWSTTGEFDGKRTVKSVHVDDGEPPYAFFDERSEPWSCLCCCLTHRAPVLAADGKPLREGETVWHEDGTELRVLGFRHEEDDETIVKVERVSGPTKWCECRSLSLTHERPEIDTWERLEEDATMNPFDYCKDAGIDVPDPRDGIFISDVIEPFAKDLVRRARALAERDA